MRKLTDLPDRELAELLGLTAGEAREWLKVAESISRGNELNALDAITIPPRISSMLQSIRHLARLSVEEVRWLIHSGELYRLYPYYNTKPPEYIGLRWRQLQDSLSDENEFSTRYPAAYEAVFGHTPTSGLPLPSLGIRVMRNAPQAHLIRAGWVTEWRASQDSSDAYSATFHRGEKGVPPVDQEYLPIDLGYLRGVLLAIVAREEHAERVATELHRHELYESPGAPRPSLIRITDLRLAKDIRPKELRDELTPLMSSLKAPITAERVAQWKRHVLKEDFDPKAYEHHNKDNQTISVSFAAAAILLFLDLNMPGTLDAEPSLLGKRIFSLHEIVNALIEKLDDSARNLEKLLTSRGAGRPRKNLDSKYHEALWRYRSGHTLEEIAEWWGMKPYRSQTVEGTRPWRSRIVEYIHRGAEVEKNKFPYIAAVFAVSDEPEVRDKACRAYHALQEESPYVSEDESPWFRVGKRVGIDVSTEQGLYTVSAYAQLGYCLLNDRSLLPEFPSS